MYRALQEIRVHKVFLAQVAGKKRLLFDNILSGGNQFLRGYVKKVLIADSLSIWLVDPVFLNPSEFSSMGVWLGVFAFYIQIYYDFSGYSDMAIGLARILGFNFPENFNLPYIASNPREFWQRWR